MYYAEEKVNNAGICILGEFNLTDVSTRTWQNIIMTLTDISHGYTDDIDVPYMCMRDEMMLIYSQCPS